MGIHGNTPEWMVYNGRSCENGWCGGTPSSGNLQYMVGASNKSAPEMTEMATEFKFQNRRLWNVLWSHGENTPLIVIVEGKIWWLTTRMHRLALTLVNNSYNPKVWNQLLAHKHAYNDRYIYIYNIYIYMYIYIHKPENGGRKPAPTSSNMPHRTWPPVELRILHCLNMPRSFLY